MSEYVAGSIVSINISTKKGVRKTPVESGELLPKVGLVGDAHCGDHHRHLSLLAIESIEKMQSMGAMVNPGDFAENITTRGVELFSLPLGTKIQIGGVLTEVTQIGKECHKGCAIREEVGDCIMPREGIFVRVLTPGTVRAGDKVVLL